MFSLLQIIFGTSPGAMDVMEHGDRNCDNTYKDKVDARRWFRYCH